MSVPGPAPSRRALLLCLHSHQPVGNFDSVIEGATRDAYLPFLQTLADFPSVKVTIHFSGFLLRWLVERSPDTFSLLKLLSDRGQAEVLGGGMYEPILTLLPERDRQGQIEALAAEVERLFGKAPEGIWLAERVWEPDLPATLEAAGVKYLPVDDYHFVRAGLSPGELDGVYLTEYNGAALRVFPGSERLRYLIPFGDVGETLREIERLTSRAVPYPAAIFADDGEKFGVWPGTHRSVYGEGWLRRFFAGVAERADWLTTMTFREYVSVAPPRGTVYLPTCSYAEMGEWALPPRPAARFGDLLHELRAGKMGEMKPFLQGGYFRNFLRKYDESNQLHKRMLWVSDRVAEARRVRPARGRAACDFLYRAQSNDVYWHGVFGGLYLNHLREAAYANLLRAEAASDAVLHGEKERWTEVARGDIDRDGGEELLLKTSGLTLLSHAHDGGAVTEISLPRRAVALGHVLTRREEGYHEKFRRAAGSFDGSTSIHDAMVLKDSSVLSALGADPWQRASFRETYYGDGDLPEVILSGGAAPRCVTAGRKASVTVRAAAEPPLRGVRGPLRRGGDRSPPGEDAGSSRGRGAVRGAVPARKSWSGDGVGVVLLGVEPEHAFGRRAGPVLRGDGRSARPFLFRGREGGARFPRRRRLAKRGCGCGPRQGVCRAAGADRDGVPFRVGGGEDPPGGLPADSLPRPAGAGKA